MLCKVSGKAFDCRKIIYRDLGFGSDPGVPLLDVEIELLPDEAMLKFAALIAAFVEQCRVDDLEGSEIAVPQLVELGYPRVDDLFKRYPKLLSELIAKYMYFDVLDVLFYENKREMWRVAINSIDAVDVTEGSVRISGKGYAI